MTFLFAKNLFSICRCIGLLRKLFSFSTPIISTPVTIVIRYNVTRKKLRRKSATELFSIIALGWQDVSSCLCKRQSRCLAYASGKADYTLVDNITAVIFKTTLYSFMSLSMKSSRSFSMSSMKDEPRMTVSESSTTNSSAMCSPLSFSRMKE